MPTQTIDTRILTVEECALISHGNGNTEQVGVNGRLVTGVVHDVRRMLRLRFAEYISEIKDNYCETAAISGRSNITTFFFRLLVLVL